MTYTLEGQSLICIGIVPEADMWTIVASCSLAWTLSRGDIVTSVLCVTKDVRLSGWTIELLADEGSATELHEDSVLLDLPVHPEKTEAGNVRQFFYEGQSRVPSDGLDTSVSMLQESRS